MATAADRSARGVGACNNNNSPNAKNNSSAVFCLVTSKDVLNGRGAPILNHEGNVRFRALVRAKTAEYTATTRIAAKDKIARGIVQEIECTGGQFLQRMKPSPSEQEKDLKIVGLVPQTRWKQINDRAALDKVKQAFRDDRCHKSDHLTTHESLSSTMQRNPASSSSQAQQRQTCPPSQ